MNPATTPTPLTVADAAERAHRRIARFVRVTPLDPVILTGGRGKALLVKAEHLQHTGSFKVRGALATISGLSAAQRAAGVVTASSGNHGLGVAYALSVLGGRGLVYVPEHASATKTAAIERFGVEVRRGGADGLDAELAAREEAGRRGCVYISPYNDAEVIAGQATIGLEMSGQVGGRRVDAVVVAVGGGGLISGVASVLRRRFPGIHVVGASPAVDAAMAASVAAGRVVTPPSLPTVSDGTAGGLEDGTVTLGLCSALVSQWVLVDEASIRQAMRDYLTTAHQVVEGAAGVALAAARDLDLDGTVAVVSCGANASLDVLRDILS